MKWYLLFEAGCAACNQLGKTVEEAAAGKLEAISIRDPQAVEWLDQAYPDGWKHQPYLVAVDGERVEVATGMGMILRLGLVLGPRKAWRVLSQIRQMRLARVDHIGRRRFLVRGAAATVWAAILVATGGRLGKGQLFGVPVAEAFCDCAWEPYCCNFYDTFCACIAGCCFGWRELWIRYLCDDCCGNPCYFESYLSCCDCCGIA